jgi:hypothetical protein
MICSRCTTELPAMATICPQCGSSVTWGQSTSFSYLPPGAPPWPIRVPEKLPYFAEAKANEPFARVAKADVKVRARPRVLALRVISMILVLLITPIVGVLATFGVLALQGQFAPHPHTSLSHLPSRAAATSGTTLPPPSVFKLTSDGTMNISVQCPTDWTVGPSDPSGDPVEFPITQPDHLVRIYISRFSNILSSQITGPDELNSELIGQMSQQFTGVKTVMAPSTEPTIANDQWTEQDATYLDQNNAQGHFTTITVFHGHQNYYNINFVVPQGLYQQAMQQYIQPILNSLRFLS